jgi:diguanylate cyclase (GGDEF)-like protein
MQTDETILKVISNETIESIHDMGIVTPSIYKSIFNKYASEHDTDISQEEKITDTLLNEKILMCQSFQTKNSQSAIQLSDNTSKAISAIKNKDENQLNEVLHETQKLRREIEKLKEAVYRDELTHAFNRRWMNETFIKDDDILNSNGTLAIIDLNYFKNVNDTHGHIVGDKVLIFIANKLRKTTENVIRYGGDEFIIMFAEDISKEAALAKLSLVREDIIRKKLKAGDASFRVSFSFGAVTYKKDDILGNVIEAADKNMYEDKIEIKKRITGI